VHKVTAPRSPQWDVRLSLAVAAAPQVVLRPEEAELGDRPGHWGIPEVDRHCRALRGPGRVLGRRGAGAHLSPWLLGPRVRNWERAGGQQGPPAMAGW
jgi:hypothetical protein